MRILTGCNERLRLIITVIAFLLNIVNVSLLKLQLMLCFLRSLKNKTRLLLKPSINYLCSFLNKS